MYTTFYCENCIAPVSGEYNAYCKAGKLIGTLVLDEGAALPPNLEGLGYYSMIKDD